MEKRGMGYLEEIRAAQADPERLENLYQAARQAKEEAAFQADLLACYQQVPDNVLYAAWYYRLQRTGQEGRAKGRTGDWKLAAPLSLVAALVFWILSGERFELSGGIPYVVLAWAPISTCFVIAFLTVASGKSKRSSVFSILGLLAAGLYVTLFVVLQRRVRYQTLMMLHLPLLAWIAAGISVMGRGSGVRNRFAFLIKSIEVFITGGLYVMAGGAFVGITVGMFEALGIDLPDPVMRLLVAGGFGLIPVLAVASVYDPHARPIGQRFQQGLGKVIATLMRLLLPLTLLMLVVYIFVIPFNFMEPFRDRDVLIVYNVMLFAVMGLLVGATPVHTSDLTPRYQPVFRIGILAVAVLAVLVSLYALSATVYRTALGGITVNRLTVIGWNGINIGVLVLLVYKQVKGGASDWIRSLQSTFSWGMVGYVAWTLFLTLGIPLLFRP